MAFLRRLLPACLVLLAPMAQALDYLSVSGAPAIMYDTPSTKGKPLFIVKPGTPVEAIVTVEGFVKVRDMQGTLAWIEKKNLSDKRTVLVRVDRAQVRAEANDNAPLVFEAERDVVLDLNGAPIGGWASVRHRDGQGGFVRTQQVIGL